MQSIARGSCSWAIAVLAAAAIFLAGAGAAQAAGLVYAQEVPVVELDPLAGYVNAPSPYEVGLVLYEGLVRFDADLRFEPALATEWSVSDGGLTWTFRLRRGVRFHDGTAFDAEAVRFNLERSMDPKQNPLNRPLWDPLESVRVIDPHTVSITTKKPFPTLLNTLAHGSAAIVSPSAVARYGKAYDQHPVGTGPFQLRSFHPGSEVTVERFDGYWGPAAGVDEITFRYIPDVTSRVGLLLAGQVDVAAAVTPQDTVRLASDRRVQVISQPTLRTVGIGIHVLNPDLQDPRVRLALNHAVDKEGIARAIFMGQAQVLESPLAPDATGYRDIGRRAYDPDRARALLAEAGWTPGPSGMVQKNGRTLTLTFITSEGSYPNDLVVVQAVTHQLRKVGVDVNIHKVDRAGYWDYLKVPAEDAGFDLFIWAFNPSNGDGGYALSSLFLSNKDPLGVPTVWNIGRYANPQVDRLLTQSDQTVDPARRNELLGEVQRILMEENPYIWLYAEMRLVAARSDVNGLVVLPTLFTDLRQAGR
ncbi:ABC transporter substrate-binding protein [Limnochorda pilosa]|uniref:Peptide ABC transporter substrate-binding protein n=1 Tax=Limnochorda pilosa TaxID=1555112 RepID=A0A0K2SLS0_LIMPI|nr:ABC transporter substrate-binding protein [Limnochorda pilosa]BAS28071.1 peptide ABC transporter substrate-binding protein [Limnochorda pilosa]